MVPTTQDEPASLRGEAISPGVAAGPLVLLVGPAEPPAARDDVSSDSTPAEEIRRFRQSVSSLVQDLERTVESLEAESHSSEADIIRAHAAILNDPEFHHQVQAAIQEARLVAEAAVERVMRQIAAVLRSSESSVLAERASDLRDLTEQMRAKLSLHPARQVPPEAAGAVLAIPELLPSVVLQGHRLGVRAFLVERGTALSHAAILARSFGIPTLRVPSVEALRPRDGQPVLVDGEAGELLLRPTEEERLHRLRAPDKGKARQPAKKLPARLWVSITDPVQLEALDWEGVEGVGLYRTETLFMQEADDFPSEDDQFRVYGRVCELAGGRPVTIRTVDIGADKPVPYLSLGPQDNPYLGMRAHRLFRFHPELLITQIRAILRAAHGHPAVRVMYPMIESVDQWLFIRELVNQAIQSLRKDGLPFSDHFEQCLLVETPAAVWDFARLLREFDYASVGTNDLVQFLFAVERNNVNLTDLYQPEHPVFLRILRTLAQEAQRAGKPLAVCGEMAGDPCLAGVLAGLGVTDLSVSPGSLGDVRARLGAATPSGCLGLATACLAAATAREVRAVLGKVAAGAAGLDLRAEAHAVDPVCGMVVHTRGNPMTFVDEGVRYYFCSRIHMLRFMDKIGGEPHV